MKARLRKKCQREGYACVFYECIPPSSVIPDWQDYCHARKHKSCIDGWGAWIMCWHDCAGCKSYIPIHRRHGFNRWRKH